MAHLLTFRFYSASFFLFSFALTNEAKTHNASRKPINSWIVAMTRRLRGDNKWIWMVSLSRIVSHAIHHIFFSRTFTSVDSWHVVSFVLFYSKLNCNVFGLDSDTSVVADLDASTANGMSCHLLKWNKYSAPSQNRQCGSRAECWRTLAQIHLIWKCRQGGHHDHYSRSCHSAYKPRRPGFGFTENAKCLFACNQNVINNCYEKTQWNGNCVRFNVNACVQ